MPVTSYEDLDVWKLAMDLVAECYSLSRSLPQDERYGLSSQLRRAAVSVPANIAEGHARRRTKEYLHHLDIAYASLAETETHLHIAIRLCFLTAEQACEAMVLASRVGQMLNRLIPSLSPEERHG